MIQTAESPDIFGGTIFCDDIRFEAGGKTSYIGSYRSRMLVHEKFPTTLPKFGFGISFWQRRSIAIRNISIQIFIPGDSDEKPFLDSKMELPAGTPGDDSKYLVIKAEIVLAALVLKEPGTLKVRALRDGMLHPLGSLQVIAAPKEQPEQQELAGAPEPSTSPG